MLWTFLFLWSTTAVVSTPGKPVFHVEWQSVDQGSTYVDSFPKKWLKPINTLRERAGDFGLTFVPDSIALKQANLTYSNGFRASMRRFKPSSIWKVLKQNIEVMYPEYGSLSLTELEMRIIEPGDVCPIQKACYQNISAFSVLIPLNAEWSMKRNFGEIRFLDRDSGDIVKSVPPLAGSLLIFKCTEFYQIMPPVIDTAGQVFFMSVEYGTVDTDLIVERPVAGWRTSDHIALMVPASVREKFEVIYPQKALTKVVKDSRGRKIFLFDNIFPGELVDALFDYTTSNATYNFMPVDSEESADNVKWLLGFDEHDFADSYLWSLLKQILAYVSGIDTYTHYDLSCNNIRLMDSATIHIDCEEGEIEYTMLIYLNKVWHADMFGETTFLTEEDLFVTAVVPKFGRLVVFDATIPHCARPPSPDQRGARYTFAIKTSVSPQTARAKYARTEYGLSEASLMAIPDGNPRKAYFKDVLSRYIGGEYIEKSILQDIHQEMDEHSIHDE